MGNEFYGAGDGRADRVNDLFAAIAPRYDLINDLQSLGLHRRWKRRLVRLAQPQTGERALDLCCGTGDVAFALERGGAHVTALDFSAPMLAVAARRRAAGSTVQFQQGDALRTPFAPGSFDIVTVSYGLRNLASVEDGLREMLRVAKPGGRLLVLDFGKPENALWRGLYLAYLRLVVPMFGRLLCRNAPAYAYICESLRHYPAQRGVDELLRALGAANPRIVNLLGGVMSINYAEKPEHAGS